VKPPRSLLVVSAPDGAAARPGPRRDIDALRQELGADVIAPSAKGKHHASQRALGLAWRAARVAGNYDAIFADGEHIGFPLAAMLRLRRSRPRLSFIGHYLSPRKKQMFARGLGVASATERLVLHSPTQIAPARSMGFDDARLAVVPYQVDPDFFLPSNGVPVDRYAAVGLEFRDYPTLLRAAAGIPVDLEVAVGSPWSKRPLNFDEREAPAHVRIARHDYPSLRDMYRRSKFVVVPLVENDFQAGIIAILEAMAMGKAVIASRTQGQVGVVSGPLMRASGLDGEIVEQPQYHANGIYVPPGDPDALAAAINYLLEHPEVAADMGANGRRLASENMTVDLFAKRIGALVRNGDSAR
jgi:glycosyltransferase involved in cell wall biosynthesis